MRQFDELWEVATRLNSPNGCPWDLKQTFFSLQPYVLEEAHEVVEAIDRGLDKEIVEELGDLLFTVLFYAQVAKREGRFSVEEILEAVKEKLIRRHPHVFGETQVASEEDVIRNWDLIKKEQEGKKKKEFLKELPALAKAQKMVKEFKKTHFSDLDKVEISSEEEIAASLWDIVEKAEKSGVDCEGVLRRLLLKKQEAFQEWETLHEHT
ncbi:MAG: MazG family protein [Rhabdochlamydiaceae bacterium]|nr:MazG family protein [Rhabdochlamydiaceae bacterium]